MNNNSSQVKPQNPSKLPGLMDINYYNPSSTYSNFWPQSPSHVNPNTGNAYGGNVLFADGHGEWHTLTPGESWRVLTDGSTGFGYWTPRFAAPAGANYLAP